MQPTILVFNAFLDFLQEGIEKTKDQEAKAMGQNLKSAMRCCRHSPYFSCRVNHF
jgi:hypothetical protein